MRLHLSIVAIFLGFTFASCGQTRATNDAIIKKWTHSVINIQGVETQEDIEEKLFDSVRHRKISANRAAEIEDSAEYYSPRFSGTAIFLLIGDRHYLLTARHVIVDPNAHDTTSLFQKIFVVPNKIDEGNTPSDDDPAFLMNLSAGVNWGQPYRISSFHDDWGIISLDELGAVVDSWVS
jgi:hypothetical protein